MNRRDFLRASAMAAALTALPTTRTLANVLGTDGEKAKYKPRRYDSLIDSDPVLQNFAETSMGIAFGVTDMANGYVIYSKNPDLTDGQKVYCGDGMRLRDMNDAVMLIRLTGLEPATTYYYRIGADRIYWGSKNKMKIIDTVNDKNIHSFTTAGTKAEAHFCVINDTHADFRGFDLLVKKLMELSPSCVVWNGDAINKGEPLDETKRIFLNPPISTKCFASDIPFLFCPGNHDDRSITTRHLERIWMYRQPEERSSNYWQLGRNFAVRLGDIALIGLDTAEDKLDTNPRYANLFASKPYREHQTKWLAEVLKRKDIAKAPFLVAFCHIPIYDDNAKHNPGDLAPADTAPGYEKDFAAWQRTCGNMWGPLLNKANCQLVVTAHQHHYRYLPASGDRKWAEVIGGGPHPESKHGFPTVIDGKVEDGKLVLRVYNVVNGEKLQETAFDPR